MEKTLSIETITRGMLAFQKIKQLYGNNARDEEGLVVRPDRISILRDALLTISEIMPKERSSALGVALKRSEDYSSAYREIKSHVREYRGRKTSMEQVVKTLKVVKPVLGNPQKVYFEKIIKIFDIINS